MSTADELLAEMRGGSEQVQAEAFSDAGEMSARSLMQEMRGGEVELPESYGMTEEEIERKRRGQIEDLPEMEGILAGTDAGIGKEMFVAAALLTTPDPYEMGQILESNFPEIGVVQTPENEFIAVNRNTGKKVILNKPGISQVDILQALGLMAAFTPAGGASAMAPTLGAKVAAGAAAAGATQAALEGGQALAGGEFDGEEIPVAAAFGGLAETLGPAFQAVRSKIAKPVDEFAGEIAGARAAQEGLEQASGQRVSLYPAQQTVDRSMLDKQVYLLRAPESSKQAAQALKKQNQEVYDATIGLIDTVAQDKALETGPVRFWNASKAAIENKKLLREEMTDKLYKAAFRTKPGVDETKNYLQSSIESFLDRYSEGTGPHKALREAQRVISGSNNLEQLHSAKRHIDEMIDGSMGKVYGPESARVLIQIKDRLLNEMDSISPDYKKAREAFEQASKDVVNPMESSLVGTISRMSENNLDQVAGKIFNARNVNPSVVRRARGIIEEVDPGAWNEIIRVEVQRRLGGLKELIDDTPDAVSNTPAQIQRALFGNPEKRRVFMTALDPTQRANFRYLEDILGRAKTGRQLNSHTNAQMAIRNWLKGPIRAVEGVFKPVRTAAELSEEAVVSRNTEILARAMFDPDWSGKFADIVTRKDSPATLKAMFQLFDEIGSGMQGPDQEVSE